MWANNALNCVHLQGNYTKCIFVFTTITKLNSESKFWHTLHIHTYLYIYILFNTSIILGSSMQCYLVFDVQILLLYYFVVVSQLKIEMGIECFINI